MVAGEKLLVPGTSERLRIHGFVCSPTGKRFLLHTETAGGEDGSDHWLYEPGSGDLRPVKAGDGVGFDANAFSPDERRLLGSRGADLIVFDIASGRTIPLTKDGDPDAIDNGRASLESRRPMDRLCPVRFLRRPQTGGPCARRPDLSHVPGNEI